MGHYFYKLIQILLSVAIFVLWADNSVAQGDYDKTLKARDTLFTQSQFSYRDTIIPVLDLSYNEWSEDGLSWHKNYTLADNYVRFSNDTKTTWVTIDLARQYWSFVSDSAIATNTDYANRVFIDTTAAPSNFKLWVQGDVSATYYYLGEDSLTHENLYNGGNGADGYVLSYSGGGAVWIPQAGTGGSTARNVGVAGYGVFEDSLLTELQFRNIAPYDTTIDVTLNDSTIYIKWDGSSRILTAGVGLSGGGDLGANRTINLYVPELPTFSDTIDYEADWLILNDATDGTHYKVHPQDLVDVIGVYEDSIGIGKDGNKFYLLEPQTVSETSDNLANSVGHSHRFNMDSFELIDLGDVDDSPVSGQYLKWNGTAWVTDDPSAGVSNVDLYVDSILVESDIEQINLVSDNVNLTYLGNGGVRISADTLFTTIVISDETTALTVGTAKRTFRMPIGCTLTKVRASVVTAPTDAMLIFDINEGGSSVLSTKLSIDATEKTSVTATLAAVISDSTIADDAEMTIDIDQVGSTVAGAGAKIILYYIKN